MRTWRALQTRASDDFRGEVGDAVDVAVQYVATLYGAVFASWPRSTDVTATPKLLSDGLEQNIEAEQAY